MPKRKRDPEPPEDDDIDTNYEFIEDEYEDLIDLESEFPELDYLDELDMLTEDSDFYEESYSADWTTSTRSNRIV